MLHYVMGGTLIDGTGCRPVADAVVVFDDPRITSVGIRNEIKANANEGTVIDVTGKTVLPGLINTHQHILFRYGYGPTRQHMKKSPAALTLFGIKSVLDILRHGITTIREMASVHGIGLALRDAINEGDLMGPRIITCNQPICATGGHACEYLSVEADGPDNVRREARNQLKLGADFVKMMANHDPYPRSAGEHTRAELTVEEMRAAFEEAHKWGKRTACHVMGREAIRNVIEAGVDTIDHGAYLDRELARLMAERGIYYTPTLSAYTRQTMNPRFGRGEQWAAAHRPLIEPSQRAIRVAIEEAVTVVCGTDSTGIYAEEVELLREAGMGAMESLQACTKIAAEALDLGNDLGTIEEGKLADIVVIDGDPLADPYALQNVELVIKEGTVYRPEDIRL